jgi:hypothetical protein
LATAWFAAFPDVVATADSRSTTPDKRPRDSSISRRRTSCGFAAAAPCSKSPGEGAAAPPTAGSRLCSRFSAYCSRVVASRFKLAQFSIVNILRGAWALENARERQRATVKCANVQVAKTRKKKITEKKKKNTCGDHGKRRRWGSTCANAGSLLR